MRFCRAILVVVRVALLVAVSTGNAFAQIGRVGGVVKDEGGQSLKGATITAQNPNHGQSFTATTDDKGRFTMLGLRAGLWRFFAQAPGFTPEGGTMQVRMGLPNPPISFVLKKGGVANFGPLGGITGKDLQSDLAAADLAFDQGRWDDAIEAYRNVMSKSVALSVVNLQIGEAFQRKKDYPGALGAYHALLRIDPDNQKAHLGIAATNVERGDEKAAEDALLEAARSASAGREVFFTLGERRFAEKDTEGAAHWYRKSTQADPFWGKPIYKLGLCAMTTGDTDAAASLMTQVILVDPVSPEAALAKSSLASLKK